MLSDFCDCPCWVPGPWESDPGCSASWVLDRRTFWTGDSEDETCQTSLFLNAFSRAPIVDKCIVCSIGLTHNYVVQRAFVTGSCVKGIRIWDSLTDTFFTFAYVAIFSFMYALTRSVCFGTLINFTTCPHIRVHSAIFRNSL